MDGRKRFRLSNLFRRHRDSADEKSKSPKNGGAQDGQPRDTIGPTAGPSNGERRFPQPTTAARPPLKTWGAATDSPSQEALSATDTAVLTVPEKLGNQDGSFPASSEASSDKDTLLEKEKFAKRSSNRPLWDEAVTVLRQSNEDPGIMAIVEGFASKLVGLDASGSPGTVKGLAKDIKEDMKREIKRQPRDGHTRRFVEKIVSILNKFVAVGDVAVSFDPFHAALPWAAVRFVLVVGATAWTVFNLSGPFSGEWS